MIRDVTLDLVRTFLANLYELWICVGVERVSSDCTTTRFGVARCNILQNVCEWEQAGSCPAFRHVVRTCVYRQHNMDTKSGKVW